MVGGLVDEFAFAMVFFMVVGIGIGHFIRVMLAARWHIRQVDQVLRMPSPLSSVEMAVAVMNRELPMDDRARILGLAMSEAALTAQQAGEELVKVIRGSKAGRVTSPVLEVIEETEAKVIQPQKYHAVQLPKGWAVAYVENGAEKIAWQGHCPMTARIEALAKNIAAGLVPDPVEGLLKVERLRRDLV